MNNRTEKEQELIDAAKNAEDRANIAGMNAWAYFMRHGKDSQQLVERMKKAQSAWDKARNELENYRYTTYGPY